MGSSKGSVKEASKIRRDKWWGWQDRKGEKYKGHRQAISFHDGYFKGGPRDARDGPCFQGVPNPGKKTIPRYEKANTPYDKRPGKNKRHTVIQAMGRRSWENFLARSSNGIWISDD